MAIVICAVWLAALLLADQVPVPAGRASVSVPEQPPVRITSVTPRSVVAGAGFTIAIKLPTTFGRPIALAVYRLGLNIEQYRSGPISDDDEKDGASDEPGVILHRVTTNANWTSAKSIANRASALDRYLVMIEDPLSFQVDQTLTVLGAVISASADLIEGYLQNLEKAIITAESLRGYSRVIGSAAHRLSDCSSSAVATSSSGGFYLCESDFPQSSKFANTVYLRSPGMLWALPEDTPKALWYSPDRLKTIDAQETVKWMTHVQAHPLSEEIAAVALATKALPLDSSRAALARLDSLKARAAAAGIKF